jgi:hypothetical protein
MPRQSYRQIAERYLEFARQYCAASGAAPSPPQG